MKCYINVSKSLWGGSSWFNVHEDKQGVTTPAAAARCSTSLVLD